MSRAPFGAVIVAAGSGTRMGRAKQFLPLLGRPVVEWSLEAFLSMPEARSIALVMTPEDCRRHGPRLGSSRVRVVEGGTTRMGSVRNGVSALRRGLSVVAVHDGARPLVTPEIVRRTVAAARRVGAAVAAVPAKDTLKEVGGDLRVRATPDRRSLWQAQTPQSYRRKLLDMALERFAGEREATDESQLVERLGRRVVVVESSYDNIKITTPEDLVVAGALLDARLGGTSREPRTGFGYDIHRLVAGRELWLAGLRLPKAAKGLLGHSDGDVVLHAASDAVLGALGEGEIGIAFPPSEPRFRGLASRRIVEHVLRRVAARRAALRHLDVTVVAEEPKLKPFYPALSASLASVFGLDPGRVNFKAKSHEGLGALGRGEAIACYAVASLSVSG